MRGQVRTDDGAFIYITYRGLIELNDAARRALTEGGETAFKYQYFRIAPEIETGDERTRG